jgi:branched-chain amino acid transport system substrate-binding protein
VGEERTMDGQADRRLSRRNFLRGGAAAGAGLAGMALLGCGGGDDDKQTTTNATPQSSGGSPAAQATTAGGGTSAFKLDTNDIGVGFISSFNGPLAPIYAEFVAGAKLAIDEINEKGGIGGAKLSLVQADDQSNPAQVPAAALGLVDKKIKFCCGPIGSNAISASPALNQGKIIQAGYSDNPELANVSKFPYSFRFVWSPEQSSKLLVDYFMKQLSVDKIAVLGENTVYGQTDLPTTIKYLESVGLKPAMQEYFQPGTADFVPLLRKVQDSGAKGIVWWTQGGPEGVTIIRNMEDIKLNIPIAGIGFIAGVLKTAVPAERLENVYSVGWKRTTYTDTEPAPQKYLDFQKRLDAVNGLGQLGSGGTAPFYDYIYYLKAAIEGTKGVDTKAIVEWMEKNPYDGVLANYSAITNKDHSTTKEDQITLGVVGSYEQTKRPLLKRAKGL